MNDFFNYKILGTFAGTITATSLIVEFIKDIGVLKKIPTRYLVLTISLFLVTITAIATNEFTLKNIPLYLLNSILVATSSIGGWHITNQAINQKK